MKCGIGDYLQRLAEAIAATGKVEVFVYTSNSSEVPFSEENPRVMPLIQHWNWWTIAKISRAISQIQPDLVHIQYPTAGYKKSKAVQFLPAFIKARNNNIKIVQTWHDPFNFYWKGYEVFETFYDKSTFSNINDIFDRIEIFEGDIRNYDNLKKIIEKIQPDEIYHLAAISFVPTSLKNPKLTFDTNLYGTLNLYQVIIE